MARQPNLQTISGYPTTWNDPCPRRFFFLEGSALGRRGSFDGSNLDAWVGRGGTAPKWLVKDGAVQVVPGSGSITTKQSFGDAQIHVEWMEPNPPSGPAQNKGNSGVIIMGVYEIQVLDDIANKTYADGISGSVYGQYPPLVDAAKNPGSGSHTTYSFVARVSTPPDA